MKIVTKIDDFLEQDRNIIFLSAIFLLIIALPLLILGGNAPYDVWDNLDSNVVGRKLMADSNLFFVGNYTSVPQIMSGVPRVSLGSELNLFILLAKVFSPAESLAVNRFLQIMIGFFGMFLLCRHYIIKNNGALPAAIVAILFAILPFWSSGCLSIAMQPLVLFSFLRIRDNKHKKWDWVILAVYPVVSSLVVFGFFFFCFLFVFFCRDWLKNRRINWLLFTALLVLSVLSIVTQYREILCLFADNGFVSHRTESTRAQAIMSFSKCMESAKEYFLQGQNHSSSNHYLIWWFCASFVFFKLLITEKINKKIIILLLIIAAICLFSNLLHWKPLHAIVNTISVFQLFNIERFYTLFPILWFIVFAYTINEIPKHQYTLCFFALIFIVQLQYSGKHDYTYNGLRKKYIYHIQDEKTMSFDEYYAENIFNDIKRTIGKPVDSYRVAALGIHPAQLLYNGFYTIDGYCANYDVKYKHLFGNLIRGELNRDKKLEIYFDKWGSRCYLFDDEVGKFGNYRANQTETSALDIDYDIMKQLNCRYIISSVKIENLGEHLRLQSEFQNDLWKIYLYEVI